MYSVYIKKGDIAMKTYYYKNKEFNVHDEKEIYEMCIKTMPKSMVTIQVRNGTRSSMCPYITRKNCVYEGLTASLDRAIFSKGKKKYTLCFGQVINIIKEK